MMSSIPMKRAGELRHSVSRILWDKPEGLAGKVVLSLIPNPMRLTEDKIIYSPDKIHCSRKSGADHYNIYSVAYCF
jgi:hypothetical protein